MDLNQQRLIDTFVDLAKIPSPSGKEQQISLYILDFLKKHNIETHIDNFGNIIARIPGKGDPIILCAHLDTVEVGEEEVNIKFKDNIITSDGKTILGADNKDSVTAILEMVNYLKEKKINHRSLELVFTLGEEAISVGAKNLDLSLISGKQCLISDLGDKYGSIIYSSPYLFKFNATFIGKRAHSKHTKQGISAISALTDALSRIRHGKTDDYTTLNIGYIIGGLESYLKNEKYNLEVLEKQNRNTVPDIAKSFAEIRGSKIDLINDLITKIKFEFELVRKKYKADVKLEFEKLVDGYFFEKNNVFIQQISNIFQKQAVQPIEYHSLGGSDANILNGKGIETIVIGSCHRKNHTYSEYLIINDLLKLTDFYIKLVQLEK